MATNAEAAARRDGGDNGGSLQHGLKVGGAAAVGLQWALGAAAAAAFGAGLLAGLRQRRPLLLG